MTESQLLSKSGQNGFQKHGKLRAHFRAFKKLAPTDLSLVCLQDLKEKHYVSVLHSLHFSRQSLRCLAFNRSLMNIGKRRENLPVSSHPSCKLAADRL
jgi:hypothetical protein